MASQLDLFGARRPRATPAPLPPANYSDTSRAAAKAHAGQAAEQRARVLSELQRRGAHGGTNEELAVALRMRVTSVCGRIGELKALEQVVDSGMRRAGASGLKHKVWVITEVARG